MHKVHFFFSLTSFFLLVLVSVCFFSISNLSWKSPEGFGVWRVACGPSPRLSRRFLTLFFILSIEKMLPSWCNSLLFFKKRCVLLLRILVSCYWFPKHLLAPQASLRRLPKVCCLFFLWREFWMFFFAALVSPHRRTLNKKRACKLSPSTFGANDCFPYGGHLRVRVPFFLEICFPRKCCTPTIIGWLSPQKSMTCLPHPV